MQVSSGMWGCGNRRMNQSTTFGHSVTAIQNDIDRSFSIPSPSQKFVGVASDLHAHTLFQ